MATRKQKSQAAADKTAAASKAKKSKKVDVDLIVAAADSGARTAGGMVGRFTLALAFIWSCFHLYIASDVPFVLSEQLGLNLVFNSQEARQIHLAFALVLASLTFPLFRKSPRDRVPIYDWGLLLLGLSACFYLLIYKNDISDRAGLPTTSDLVLSSLGMIALGIAVFRSLGLPLVIVVSVFVFYVFFGHLSIMPDVVQWKGASFGKAMWHFWMQTEGVFGVALGVSASLIFLFVLFGSLLEKAGAGNYFIKLAFALLGHLRGGPAKAAVVASALSGVYSGSSIANVVTTGTFTIPLMKRTGFSPEKAGAVEVASSTNGQLTPPVMGAAAFLIAEFTGTPYPELVKHAFLPAVISYIALIYIVHLEAVKLNLKGLQRPPAILTLAQKLSGVLFGFLAMGVLSAVVYFGFGWIKVAFPNIVFSTAALLVLGAYLLLVWLASKRPDLEVDDPKAPLKVLPRPGAVAITGLHFILPIVILIWCILVERLSPALSAYWASVAMIIVVLTQKPLKRFFRNQGDYRQGFSDGFRDFVDGMIAGARNMIGIGVATGAAGIIIGTVSLTGAHQVVGELVEFLSGGSLIAMLLLVAVMSLILGMGLPTTANYIVVSSLMAPVIVSVGAQSGLIVPLVAVHLFVFYFGILADDTPPVGLAAFAAAAISGGDPIKTGLQGFSYDIRTALLPFLFIFNTELLLIDVGAWKAVFIFIVAVVAMMLFAAATQRYFLVKSRVWETLALLLVAFTLFRPGFWLDRVDAPYIDLPAAQITQQVDQLESEGGLRLAIIGPDFDHPTEMTQRTVLAPIKAPDGSTSAKDRLFAAGISVLDVVEGGSDVALDEPFAGTSLFEELSVFDFYTDNPVRITAIQVDKPRIAKEIFYIPAILLLGVVVLMQRRRKKMKLAN